MSRHIGILSCSAEGAALCYRTICLDAEKLMGRHAHPEVTLHTISLAEYMKPLEAGDWPAVAELMLRSVEVLRRAGADFVICPDNTIHQALPLVLSRSPLPWLHMAEEVGREAQRRGFESLDMGFDRENVLLFKLNARQAGHSDPEIISFFSDLGKLAPHRRRGLGLACGPARHAAPGARAQRTWFRLRLHGHACLGRGTWFLHDHADSAFERARIR
jgi:hypothetical protein